MTTNMDAMLAAVKEMGALAPAPVLVKKRDDFKWVDPGKDYIESADAIVAGLLDFFADDEHTAAMKNAAKLEAQSRARAKAADISAPLYDGML